MVGDYLATIAQQVGISVWFLIVIIIWEIVWKLIAMWKSAKNNHYAWFIILAIVNIAGILSILYIFIFSKIKLKKNSKKK
jgi:hypothetical protein